MQLDELPELVLSKICLKLNFGDLKSLRHSSSKLFNHIRNNQVYYDKHQVLVIEIVLPENGGRRIRITKENGRKMETDLSASLYQKITLLTPRKLISYDHDELANMHPRWWREINNIKLTNLLNYQRYLPYLDRCKSISLVHNTPMILSNILASMETKNLEYFSVSGPGELTCTDDDLRKIASISNKMKYFDLGHLSDSSDLSNNAILDMVQSGSFVSYAVVKLSKIQDDLRQCLEEKGWIIQLSRPGFHLIRIDYSQRLIMVIKNWDSYVDTESDSSSSDSDSD